MLYALSDVIAILLYIVLSFLFSVFFFFVKVKAYSKNARPQYRIENEETVSKKVVLFIILVVFLGISLPFLLLLLVDPLIWFLIITSFIAGINIPEIIFYFRSAKYWYNKKEETDK